MQYGAANLAGDSLTQLVSSVSTTAFVVDQTGTGTAIGASGTGSAVIRATNNGTGSAIAGFTSGGATAAVYGSSPTGYGVVGDAGDGVDAAAGVAGRDATTGGHVGVAGQSGYGTGVTGTAGIALLGHQPDVALDAGGTPEPTGVYGYAAAGVGVRARSDSGIALKVTGKTRLSRSGRVTATAGRTWVDITVAGGVTTASLCFASLGAYRAGVFIAAIRPAYPTTAKIRVYFSKALPAATPVAWFVTD